MLKSSESHKHQLDSIIDQDDYGIYKIIFTYEENGNRISVFYDWDSEISAWIKPLKLEDTFDENGNMTSETTYNWNAVSNEWVEASKITYTYDESGKQTLFAYYNWRSGINDWVGFYKSESTYDYTISASEIRLPYGNFTHKIVDKVSYEFRDGNWVHDFTTEFFYSEIASSYLKELDVHAVRLFPNPATDFISIQGVEGENYQFKLLNLQGSTLLSKENNGNEQISVQSLASGIYMYQIIDSNGNHKTGKIVIE